LPKAVAEQCKALGLPVSGNAAGHASTTDLKGLPLGPYLQKTGWQPRAIGAMAGCVLAAALGMIIVVWYALGGQISDEEIEQEVLAKRENKEKRKDFFKGLIPKKQGETSQVVGS